MPKKTPIANIEQATQCDVKPHLLVGDVDGERHIRVLGEWRLLAFQDHLDDLEEELDELSERISEQRKAASQTTGQIAGRTAGVSDDSPEAEEASDPSDLPWDLSELTDLDSAGALVLWTHWEQQMPKQLKMQPRHRALLEQLAECEPGKSSGYDDFAEEDSEQERGNALPVDQIQLTKNQQQTTSNNARGWHYKSFLLTRLTTFLEHLKAILTLFGQLLLDCVYLLRSPSRIPFREISSTIYRSGVQAVFITGLVGFLIGLVISYLTARQLKPYGADIYIVDFVGIAVFRELGPLIAAILVAGRSGSAMTAELGVMRVTEELDALRALGVSISIRLLLPKVIGLMLAMPLLVFWSDLLGLAGGMLAANQTLGLSAGQFLTELPSSLPVANVWIGLIKAMTFGFLIALTAGHFGLQVKPNSISLASETTNAVVVAITLVLIADAAFALLFLNVGLDVSL